MDDKKRVPKVSYSVPIKDDFDEIMLDTSAQAKVVSEWVARGQKDYNDMLVSVLNKHGIPFTPDKYKEYIGRLVFEEYQDYTINGQLIVIKFDGKEVCRLKKWLEVENILDPTTTTYVQHIVEVE